MTKEELHARIVDTLVILARAGNRGFPEFKAIHARAEQEGWPPLILRGRLYAFMDQLRAEQAEQA